MSVPSLIILHRDEDVNNVGIGGADPVNGSVSLTERNIITTQHKKEDLNICVFTPHLHHCLHLIQEDSPEPDLLHRLPCKAPPVLTNLLAASQRRLVQQT